MEAKGIRTDKGDFNRWVRKTNAMLREAKNKIASLPEWLKTVKEELSKPQPPMLNDLLMTYYNNCNKGAYSTKAKTANLQRYADAFRFLQEKQLFTTDDLEAVLHSMQNSISAMKASAGEKQSRIKELVELLRMAQYYVDGKPVADKLGCIRFEKSRQKYKSEHDDTLRTFYMAERTLKPYFKDGKMPITAWAESVSGWSRSTRTFRQSFRRFTLTLKSSGPFTTTFMKCSMSRSGSRHNCAAAKAK